MRGLAMLGLLSVLCAGCAATAAAPNGHAIDPYAYQQLETECAAYKASHNGAEPDVGLGILNTRSAQVAYACEHPMDRNGYVFRGGWYGYSGYEGPPPAGAESSGSFAAKSGAAGAVGVGGAVAGMLAF